MFGALWLTQKVDVCRLAQRLELFMFRFKVLVVTTFLVDPETVVAYLILIASCVLEFNFTVMLIIIISYNCCG